MSGADPGWITNNPDAARALRRADEHYQRIRDAAAGLCLKEKVEAFRRAKECRQIAYDTIFAEYGRQS